MFQRLIFLLEISGGEEDSICVAKFITGDPNEGVYFAEIDVSAGKVLVIYLDDFGMPDANETYGWQVEVDGEIVAKGKFLLCSSFEAEAVVLKSSSRLDRLGSFISGIRLSV